MADMHQDSHQPTAGPSNSQSSKQSQAPQQQPPTQPATNPSSTSTPIPTSPRSRSRSRSRSASCSPTSHRLGSKRQSTFSPVPEEEAPLPSTSSSARQRDSEPSSKRSRTSIAATSIPRASTSVDPDRRRGARLFGVLTSTLTQFKRESETTRAATAAQKRAQIEARLANKLRDTQDAIDESERKRALLWEARCIVEDITTGDVQRKTLRGMKRRMASFLYTPTSTDTRRRRRRRSRAEGEGEGERLAEDIPTSLAPISRADDRDGRYAVYFLPGKTLPQQEDELNHQEDKVDEEIDAFDDAWEDKRRRLVERLEAVKRRIREV
ncbi:uncharacterized protein UTRI_05494_B [Ustilago trichophora]|uniref:Pinin/SDK/MemA protein domain-containing protein n=1 Tax=Ustilago trichophora TaxID=86804 RepID=A0A5C3EK38_9BASI|nr:uncharacterized protein UTRI_05494_B [Ustilago trichophora]